MPRASWRGFLRLSLVSCPIYLSPATTRAKSIRLHQVWQPTPVDVAEDAWSDYAELERLWRRLLPGAARGQAGGGGPAPHAVPETSFKPARPAPRSRRLRSG